MDENVIDFTSFKKKQQQENYYNIPRYIAEAFYFINVYLLNQEQELGALYHDAVDRFYTYSQQPSQAVCEYTFSPSPLFMKHIAVSSQTNPVQIDLSSETKKVLEDIVSLYNFYHGHGEEIPNLNSKEVFDWSINLYVEQFLHALYQNTNDIHSAWKFPQRLKVINNKKTPPELQRKLSSKNIETLLISDDGVSIKKEK